MPTPQQWDKIRKEKQSRIDKAISQREKSIAYFNSTNSAISILQGRDLTDAQLKKELLAWRIHFYELWQDWFLESMPKLHWAEKQPKKAVTEEVITEVVEEEGFKAEQQQEKVEEINLELTE